MTVFGFGRDDKGNAFLTGQQKFVVGFYPKKIAGKKQHQKFSGYLEKLFKIK